MKKTLFFALSCLMMMLVACSDKTTPEIDPTPDPIPDPTPEVEEVEALTKIPFSKGFNLTNWLDTDDIQWFKTDTYVEKDFDDLKTLGVDVVRLPINFPLFMGSAPSYTFNDNALKVIDNVVKWGTERGMSVILDQHSYFGARVYPESYGEELVSSGLRQLTTRFKDNDKVIIELFNEPGGSYMEKNYNELQLRLLKQVRNIDKNKIVVATAYGCSRKKLTELPDIDDKRVIYTFHFYVPFLFTHQGAEWNSMKNITGVPYPYDAAKMPSMPSSFQGEDIDYYTSYPSQGNAKYIADELMGVYSWATSKGKLVFCGEFGTLNTAHKADRARWYKDICDNFAAFDIPWIAWEYSSTTQPNFGIFNGAKNFNVNLNTDLVKAMGLTLPPAYQSGCPEVVYYDDGAQDWWKQGGGWSGYTPNVDFDCKDNPYDGSLKCVKWEIDHAWGAFTMSVWPVTDYTTQYQANANLEFAVRTTETIDQMIVRFVQRKPSAPWQWRNIITLSTTDGKKSDFQFENDGQWHYIQVPLSKFHIVGTQGDWKNGPDEGEEGFAWDAVEHLEFAPEGNSSLVGKTVYFDHIVIKK